MKSRMNSTNKRYRFTLYKFLIQKKTIQFQNKITQTREKCPCGIAQSQIPRTANKCQDLSDLEMIMICKPFYQFISYEVIIPNELCKGDQIKMDSYFSWE